MIVRRSHHTTGLNLTTLHRRQVKSMKHLLEYAHIASKTTSGSSYLVFLLLWRSTRIVSPAALFSSRRLSNKGSETCK